MRRRIGAGGQRGVADDGLGIGVGMVCVAVYDPVFQQVSEAAFTKPVVVARWQVAAQLVHGDLQHQPGFFPAGG